MQTWRDIYIINQSLAFILQFKLLQKSTLEQLLASVMEQEDHDSERIMVPTTNQYINHV